MLKQAEVTSSDYCSERLWINLLLTNIDAGHGGKSGRFKRNEDIALEYTFLLIVKDK
ncbi:MAG: hypothetical protein ACSLEN_09205 [Candidatus Malihini olakiniferum]